MEQDALEKYLTTLEERAAWYEKNVKVGLGQVAPHLVVEVIIHELEKLKAG